MDEIDKSPESGVDKMVQILPIFIHNMLDWENDFLEVELTKKQAEEILEKLKK